MRTTTKNIIRLAGLVFLAGVYSAAHANQDAVTLSNESLQALSRYEAQLEDLETRFGPYHASLMEPLESMEGVLREQGQYARVAELQRRRLQLMRTALGFEHPDLVPLLEDTILTDLQLANWQGVTDTLVHIRHLQTVNYGADSDQAMAIMERQAEWYLARVYLDHDADREDFVLDARDLFDETLNLAEDKYGEGSPELIPWLYRRALSLYYIVAFMNTDSGLAGSTIDEVFRRDGSARLQTLGRGSVINLFGPRSHIPIVEGDEPVGVAYLRQALGYINDIEEIAEAEENPELRAMTALYHGDFLILMDRSSGVNDIRDARELFIEAGLDPARVDAVLAVPMAIPLENFFTSFAELEAYQQRVLSAYDPTSQDGTDPDGDAEFVNVGEFTAWEEDLHAVPRPANIDRRFQLQIPTNQVDLEFRINSRGEVSSIDVLGAQPDEKNVERVGWRALREVRFRPAFIDNRTRVVKNARLRYLYHAKEPVDESEQ